MRLIDLLLIIIIIIEAEILTCLMNVDVDTILNGTRASQPTTIEIPEQPYTIIARGEGILFYNNDD